MKTPRFFLGAVVLFWGWQVQALWIAIFPAVILESARMVKEKFEFKPSDFNKFVDVSTILLAGTIVAALTIEPEKAILILLKWIPLILFPIVCAQEFSANNKMDIQSFFLASRKKGNIQFYEPRYIDVTYLFSLFCILSSGTANTKGPVFYASIVLFFAWSAWSGRSRRVSFSMWALCIFAVIVLGYGGHKTIRAASIRINQWIMGYYFDSFHMDPFKSVTALGEIGELKLSQRILLRVSFQDYVPGNTYLLHSTTYNRFSVSNWFARAEFEPVLSSQDQTFWQVNPPAGPTRKMTLYLRLKKKKAVLSLPPGVIDISEMKAGLCEKNKMQVIRVDDGPSLIKAVVSYTGDALYDAPPYEDDFLIPAKEAAAITGIAQQLGLENKTEQETLHALQQYFLTEFTYSLDLKGKGKHQTPLQNFLTDTRAGHCEFFATATVLLLRQANIPARYVTGYIAHEYSRMENALVVRLRDGHAWVKVFINGQWQDFDTTPPSFLLMDRENVKPSLIEDLLSFLGFKLSQLRHETGAKLMNQYGLWLTLPLGVILFVRLRKSNKIKRIRDTGNAGEKKERDRPPEGFDRVAALLSDRGFPRYSWETYGAWLNRIQGRLESHDIMDALQMLLHHHNRLRFSRPGPTGDEKARLDNDVTMILEKLSSLS